MEKICPYSKECGGCDYQGIDYKEQLKKKLHKANSLIGSYIKLDNIIGMENPYYYRNKVTATFSKTKGGKVISGVYKEGTHKVIGIEKCRIENESANAIIETIRKLVVSFKLPIYDEDRRTGILRHVLIRYGYNTGEIMVVLITGNSIFPSKNNFCRELKRLHPEITTIVHNINDKATSMVLGEKENIVIGKGYIEDILCGYRFRISPKSFYQINSKQTEYLYKKAIDYCEFTGNERIIDAYCGIGTIGIFASDKVKEVLGVELNKAAVKDAIVNAKLNNIKNIRFINEDAGKFMEKLAAAGESVDAVIMDPPRAGSTEAFMFSILTLKPKKVVYISCNPATQARDLKYLTKHGYKCIKGVAVDMFPFTDNIETVCLLSN